MEEAFPCRRQIPEDWWSQRDHKGSLIRITQFPFGFFVEPPWVVIRLSQMVVEVDVVVFWFNVLTRPPVLT